MLLGSQLQLRGLGQALKTDTVRDSRGIPAAKQPGANRQVQLVYKAKPEQLKIQHTASFAKEAFYIPVTAQAAKCLAKRNRLGAVNDHLIRNILELGQAPGRGLAGDKNKDW